MNHPVAYGIDFGTSNSSIAVAYTDRVEIIKTSRHSLPTLMPSVVYLHREGVRSAGELAIEQYLVTGAQRTVCRQCDLVERSRGQAFTDCKQYRPAGSCQDARVIAELKSELASTGFNATHSWAVDFSLPDLVSIIIRELKRAADRATGVSLRRAVIGCPVAFVGAEGPEFASRQQVAVERLSRAAQMAGLEEIELLEEPVAVIVDEQLLEGLALVVDFGGGTCDIAVVELRQDQGEVLALQGAEIGGERFTAALFDSKVAPVLGLDGSVPGIPLWIGDYFRTLGGIMHLLSHPDVPSILRSAAIGRRGASIKIVEEILYGGHSYGFHRAIEEAKIALSVHPTTMIEFHRPRIHISIPVTRPEFETLIAADLEVIRKSIRAALDQAGLAPEHVQAIIRTGGSSSIPAFVRLLEELFGALKIHERPPFTTIVHGLAAYARMRWVA